MWETHSVNSFGPCCNVVGALYSQGKYRPTARFSLEFPRDISSAKYCEIEPFSTPPSVSSLSPVAICDPFLKFLILLSVWKSARNSSTSLRYCRMQSAVLFVNTGGFGGKPSTVPFGRLPPRSCSTMPTSSSRLWSGMFVLNFSDCTSSKAICRES